VSQARLLLQASRKAGRWLPFPALALFVYRGQAKAPRSIRPLHHQRKRNPPSSRRLSEAIVLELFSASSFVFCKAYLTTDTKKYSSSPSSHQSDHTQSPQKKKEELICWKCGRNLKIQRDLLCSRCHVPQPPLQEKRNFFSIFSLEPKFKISLTELDKIYKGLQRQLHPDRYTTASDRIQEYSTENASLVNEAYSTLRDPLERAKYLLAIKGRDFREDRKFENKDLLLKVMETREAIEEAKSIKELRGLAKTNDEEISEIIRKITNAFDGNELDVAEHLLDQLVYLMKIQKEVDERLPAKE